MAVLPTEATCLSRDWIADVSFFNRLRAEDARVAAAVKLAGCQPCGGRLDRANYPRKPRGGDVAVVGEALDSRCSFCCAREGCRKRATPPSLVFLGRRVYLAVTIVITAWRSMVTVTPPPSSPSRRTLRRWLAWFAFELPATPWFTTVKARLSPPMEPSERLPGALVERFLGHHPVGEAIPATLRLFAPLSTVTATMRSTA